MDLHWSCRVYCAVARWTLIAISYCDQEEQEEEEEEEEMEVISPSLQRWWGYQHYLFRGGRETGEWRGGVGELGWGQLENTVVLVKIPASLENLVKKPCTAHYTVHSLEHWQCTSPSCPMV